MHVIPNNLAQYRERLATLSGVTIHDGVSAPPGWSTGKPNTKEYRFHPWEWRPDEDIAQAILLLETFSPDWVIDRDSFGRTYITVRLGLTEKLEHMPLPAAIVTAVVKALGWESE